ncbi:MAG: tryptophan--tRNA ligase [Candidatus Pacebacteria bacterium]|nr:tryptophan--tRNA ligase [Candidatus Paceibacterota bacterium]
MRIFSGIQPSGDIHIGNYLGAIKQWVALQNKVYPVRGGISNKADCIFCIVDWHAITVPYNQTMLQRKIKEVAAIYLAAGLSPEKNIIFVQSQVKEHAELAWLLNTITPLGDLQRMTQFKEKAAKQANVEAGLFNYPVLMAADILLYQTDIVPVGEDQKQHVELTREIARRFNTRFGKTELSSGEVFSLPKAQTLKIGAKIMSLTAPDKKMSKSDKNPQASITLFDSPEQIKKKISSATTDSGHEIKFQPKEKPGISNLLTIYSLFSDKSIKDLEKAFLGKSYQEFKASLSEILIEKLKPFRNKKAELDKSPESIEKILADGALRAQKIAQATMQKVRTSMGLL